VEKNRMANAIASPSSNRHQLDKPTHENLAREILEVDYASYCLWAIDRESVSTASRMDLPRPIIFST
jgi:hypothetical protein